MDNLYYAINLFPAGVSVYFWLLMAIRRNKSDLEFAMTGMIFYCMSYFLYQSVYYSPASTPGELAVVNIIGHAVSPVMLYVIFRTLYLYHPSNKPKRNTRFLFGVALFLGSLSLMPLLLTGWSNVLLFWEHYGRNSNFFPSELKGIQALESFYLLNMTIYNVVILLVLLLIIIYIVHCMIKDKSDFTELWNFWFHGLESTPNRLSYHIIFWSMILCIVRVLIGRYYAIQYPWLFGITSVFISFCMLSIGFIGIASGFDQFTRAELFHPMARTAEAMENTSNSRAVSVDQREEEIIRKHLTQLMEVDLIFTDPMLTVEDVAVKLNTNRVFLNRLIDSKYKLSFRDYLNMKRLDYAMQLMLQSPALSQQELAQRCGFPDAATFNKRFSQREGITPNKWRKAHLPNA